MYLPDGALWTKLLLRPSCWKRRQYGFEQLSALTSSVIAYSLASCLTFSHLYVTFCYNYSLFSNFFSSFNFAYFASTSLLSLKYRLFSNLFSVLFLSKLCLLVLLVQFRPTNLIFFLDLNVLAWWSPVGETSFVPDLSLCLHHQYICRLKGNYYSSSALRCCCVLLPESADRMDSSSWVLLHLPSSDHP